MRLLFDFDKTITNNDTLLGFYLFAIRERLFRSLLLPIYMFYVILHSFKIVSNDYLKHIGFSFFIKNLNLKDLDKISKMYAKKIKLNDFYSQLIESLIDKEIVISTASYECYVSPIFSSYSNVTIYGSRFLICSNKVVGILNNNYGLNKLNSLEGYASNYFDKSYSDSASDIIFLSVSKEFNIVRSGKIIKTIRS